MVLSVVPSALEAFTAANSGAAAMITDASSGDSVAMLSAAAAAVGPIGAGYLAAFGPAQASNLASAQLVGAVHGAIAGATEASRVSFVATDNG